MCTHIPFYQFLTTYLLIESDLLSVFILLSSLHLYFFFIHCMHPTIFHVYLFFMSMLPFYKSWLPIVFNLLSLMCTFVSINFAQYVSSSITANFLYVALLYFNYFLPTINYKFLAFFSLYAYSYQLCLLWFLSVNFLLCHDSLYQLYPYKFPVYLLHASPCLSIFFFFLFFCFNTT